jgi:signal transduction histidine kinase
MPHTAFIERHGRTRLARYVLFGATTLIVWILLFILLKAFEMLSDDPFISRAYYEHAQREHAQREHAQREHRQVRGRAIVVHRDSLAMPESQSILLKDKGKVIALHRAGWKFHPGDSLVWRMNQYNDTLWQTVFSTERAIYAPGFLQGNIGWYRLPIVVDSTMCGQSAVIHLQGFRFYEVLWLGMPTMQVYFNERIIGSIGKPSALPDEEIHVNHQMQQGIMCILPEVPGTYTLAVRASLYEAQSIGKKLSAVGGAVVPPNVGFVATIALPASANKMKESQEFEAYLLVFCTAVPSIIGILHTIIFVMYRQNTLHLHLALHALCGVLFGITNLYRVDVFALSNLQFALNTHLNGLLYSMIWMTLIASVYALTRTKIPLIAWLGMYILLLLRVLVATFDLSNPIQLIGYAMVSQNATNCIGGVLVVAEIIAAIRKGQKEDYILLGGMIVLLFGMFVDMVFVGRFSVTGIDREPYVFIVTYFAFFIAMPLSMAILIAFRNASNSMRIARFNDELQLQVQEQTKELSIANTALKKLNAEKNEFLGIAAHDLNPLSSIMSYASLITEPTFFAHAPKYAQIIQESADRMSRLINHLLDVNAIESGRNFLTNTDFDLVELTRNIVVLNSVQYERKQQEIDIAVSTDNPITIHADRNATIQIVENLLSNAIKYAPMQTTIRITITQSAQSASVAIENTGEGIHPDEVPMLFQKFTKLSARPTGNEDSTGLGLSIVKLLAEQMNCTVRYEGEYNVRSLFVFEIPIH